MPTIRDNNTYLTQLYTVRDNLLTGKLQSYTLGDRTCTLVDMRALNTEIDRVEAAVMSEQTVVSDFSGSQAVSTGNFYNP